MTAIGIQRTVYLPHTALQAEKADVTLQQHKALGRVLVSAGAIAMIEAPERRDSVKSGNELKRGPTLRWLSEVLHPSRDTSNTARHEEAGLKGAGVWQP